MRIRALTPWDKLVQRRTSSANFQFAGMSVDEPFELMWRNTMPCPASAGLMVTRLRPPL